ncbi:hypothetical protein EV182_000494 [Spiromyces aspiralis]|uniref:Uncharacterized protein n=1 Tax=Spiromyces aspiralis TaxID=68401 RepID=A0ACC1HGW4_9FUNG|nr:hypothetical protein EV182_000494 [Spiromyces aspiralis]
MGAEQAAQILRQYLVTTPVLNNDDDNDNNSEDLEHQQPPANSIAPGPKVSTAATDQLADPYKLPSGDITWNFYRLQESMENSQISPALQPLSGTDLTAFDADKPPLSNATTNVPSSRPTSMVGGGGGTLKRTSSYSVLEQQAVQSSEFDIPFEHHQIMQPGGFRRAFIQEQAISQGRLLPSGITANFVDFLALYGHFAGGNYPSDEDEDGDGCDGDGRKKRVGEEEDEEGDGQQDEDDSKHVQVAATASHEIEAQTRRHGGRPAHATASVKKTFFLLVKSFISSGVLFLPQGFRSGGMIFSSIVLVISAIISTYCMLLLVQCYMRHRGSYGDIGERLYGRGLRWAIMTSIVMSQMGFTCVGHIFVAANLRDLWNDVTRCRHVFPLSWWVLAQLAFTIPMALMRKIKNFGGFALIADLFILNGLAYVLFSDFEQLAERGAAMVRMFNPASYLLFLGTAVYTFEGIGLILPIVDGMREPEKFPRVLTLTLTLTVCIFVAIGSLSYLTYGEKVESVVLLNLPQVPYTKFVQALYVVAVLFTNPLMLFPAIRIVEAGIFPFGSGKRNPRVKWQKNAIRCAIVAVITAVSINGVAKLDKLIAIIGAFACIPLSFIYPAMLHLRGAAETRWQRVVDVFLIILGLVSMGLVTVQTIRSWIYDSESPPLDRCLVTPSPETPGLGAR